MPRARASQAGALPSARASRRSGRRCTMRRRQAPNLPDGTLDQIVSSINVEREQIGPNRYIADLGVQFDRAKAAPFLGVEGGEVERSVPMLLIPVIVSGGNRDQRRAAQCLAARLGPVPDVAEPDRLCSRQRHGRGPAADKRRADESAGSWLVAKPSRNVRRDRHPGRRSSAPASLSRRTGAGRFIARHGPDNEIVGGFTLTAANSDGIPAMLAQGAQRIDQLYAQALAAGRLTRDSSLNLPPPPVMPELPRSQGRRRSMRSPRIQVQVSGNNVNFYNFAMAHLRTMPGVQSATPQQINPGGTSYILVQYKGDISQLAGGAGGTRLDRRDRRHGDARSGPAPTSRPQFRRRRCSLRQPRRRRYGSGRQSGCAAKPVKRAPGPDRAPARLAAKRRRRPVHRLRRQPGGVRAFPQIQPVAGQGDDPHRAAPLGPDFACTKLRRAGRRAGCSTRQTARRGRTVPCLEPGAGHGPAAGDGRRRGAAGLDAALA